MIDGTIARKMNTVTEFGARFDTAFDISHSPAKVFGDSCVRGGNYSGCSGRALYQNSRKKGLTRP